MLLTGGQISAAISSVVVFIFTSALFLSGYIVQQRTVHNLQAVIHPPIPPTPNVTEPAELVIPISARRQHILSAAAAVQIDWRRSAYAQLVREHRDVCGAVMLFAELARGGSPAKRALLYPAAWDAEVKSGAPMNRALRTSVRLLQKAAKQYGVALHPVKATDGAEEEDIEAMYPLARLLGLTAFDTVVSLLPAGLVLDAEMLDTVFSLVGEAGEVVALKGGPGDWPEGVVLKPSMATFQRAMREGAHGDEMPLVMQDFDLGKERPWLISQTSSLKADPVTGQDGFDATDWYDMAAYVRFSDTRNLGPQYDVPENVMVQYRPDDTQAGAVWDGLYDRFRVERMSVCGLDTIPITIPKTAEQLVTQDL